MKYTVSGSTLQYKVGLTLSFLIKSNFPGGWWNPKRNTSCCPPHRATVAGAAT
jgi:hypothetical protein